MSFAMEYVYFLTVFQCEYLPQPALCESLRDVYRMLGRLPSRDEFVLYLYQPCEDECAFDTPFEMWYALADHVIQHFGLYPRCYITYCCYQVYSELGRMPTLTEFFQEVEQRQAPDVPPEVMNEWMAQETDALWASRKAQVPLAAAPVHVAQQEDSCCLCLDPIAVAQPVRTLACGHTFHSNVFVAGADLVAPADCEGIEAWFERCASCPLCKRDVVSDPNEVD